MVSMWIACKKPYETTKDMPLVKFFMWNSALVF